MKGWIMLWFFSSCQSQKFLSPLEYETLHLLPVVGKEKVKHNVLYVHARIIIMTIDQAAG